MRVSWLCTAVLYYTILSYSWAECDRLTEMTIVFLSTWYYVCLYELCGMYLCIYLALLNTYLWKSLPLSPPDLISKCLHQGVNPMVANGHSPGQADMEVRQRHCVKLGWANTGCKGRLQVGMECCDAWLQLSIHINCMQERTVTLPFNWAPPTLTVIHISPTYPLQYVSLC